MPTYAYTCTVCGHSFDVHQSFTDLKRAEWLAYNTVVGQWEKDTYLQLW